MANRDTNETAERDRLVRNAIDFLRHPKVRDATDDAKEDFLKKQGLTSAEIKTAFEAASAEDNSLAIIPSTKTRQWSWLPNSFVTKGLVALGIVGGVIVSTGPYLQRRYGALMDALSHTQAVQSTQNDKMEVLSNQSRVEFERVKNELRKLQQEQKDRLDRMERDFFDRHRQTQIALNEMQESVKQLVEQLKQEKSEDEVSSPGSPVEEGPAMDSHHATGPVSSTSVPQAMSSVSRDGPTAHQVVQDPPSQEWQSARSDYGESEHTAQPEAAVKLGETGKDTV